MPDSCRSSPAARGRGCVKTIDDYFDCTKTRNLLDCGSILGKLDDQDSSESNSANFVLCFHTPSVVTRLRRPVSSASGGRRPKAEIQRAGLASIKLPFEPDAPRRVARWCSLGRVRPLTSWPTQREPPAPMPVHRRSQAPDLLQRPPRLRVARRRHQAGRAAWRNRRRAHRRGTRPRLGAAGLDPAPATVGYRQTPRLNMIPAKRSRAPSLPKMKAKFACSQCRDALHRTSHDALNRDFASLMQLS